MNFSTPIEPVQNPLEHLNLIDSGGSRRGARGTRPPPPLLFWVKKEEMTERRTAGRESKIVPGLLLSSKSGSATDRCVYGENRAVELLFSNTTVILFPCLTTELQNQLLHILFSNTTCFWHVFLLLKIAEIPNAHDKRGRFGGLRASALDSGASGPGSSPGRGHCVVFFGKTLNSHSASLHPGV